MEFSAIEKIVISRHRMQGKITRKLVLHRLALFVEQSGEFGLISQQLRELVQNTSIHQIVAPVTIKEFVEKLTNMVERGMRRRGAMEPPMMASWLLMSNLNRFVTMTSFQLEEGMKELVAVLWEATENAESFVSINGVKEAVEELLEEI